jgi:hypothetical protein
LKGSQTEEIDILSEEFRQHVQKIVSAVTLIKWTLCGKSSDRMSKKKKGIQPGKMDILSEEFRQDVQKIKKAVTLRKLTFQQDVLKNYEATTVGRGLKWSDATFEYLASMHTLDEHVTLCARQC